MGPYYAVTIFLKSVSVTQRLFPMAVYVKCSFFVLSNYLKVCSKTDIIILKNTFWYLRIMGPAMASLYEFSYLRYIKSH